MALSQNQIEDGLKLIAQAAANGTRCPTNRSGENPAGELSSGITSALLKQGRIRVEVYAHNWRVITILEGAHAGKRTAPSPYKGAKPYRTLPAVNQNLIS